MNDHLEECPAMVARKEIIRRLALVIEYHEVIPPQGEHVPWGEGGENGLAESLWGALIEHTPGGDESIELCTCGFETQRSVGIA